MSKSDLDRPHPENKYLQRLSDRLHSTLKLTTSSEDFLRKVKEKTKQKVEIEPINHPCPF